MSEPRSIVIIGFQEPADRIRYRSNPNYIKAESHGILIYRVGLRLKLKADEIYKQ